MVISSAATSSTTQIRPLSIANREGQLPQLVYCAQKLKELLVDLNQSLSLASTELSSNAPVRVELFREMSYVLDEVRQALDTLGENAQRRQTQRELTCVEGVSHRSAKVAKKVESDSFSPERDIYVATDMAGPSDSPGPNKITAKTSPRIDDTQAVLSDGLVVGQCPGQRLSMSSPATPVDIKSPCDVEGCQPPLFEPAHLTLAAAVNSDSLMDSTNPPIINDMTSPYSSPSVESQLLAAMESLCAEEPDTAQSRGNARDSPLPEMSLAQQDAGASARSLAYHHPILATKSGDSQFRVTTPANVQDLRLELIDVRSSIAKYEALSDELCASQSSRSHAEFINEMEKIKKELDRRNMMVGCIVQAMCALEAVASICKDAKDRKKQAPVSAPLDTSQDTQELGTSPSTPIEITPGVHSPPPVPAPLSSPIPVLVPPPLLHSQIFRPSYMTYIQATSKPLDPPKLAGTAQTINIYKFYKAVTEASDYSGDIPFESWPRIFTALRLPESLLNSQDTHMPRDTAAGLLRPLYDIYLEPFYRQYVRTFHQKWHERQSLRTTPDRSAAISQKLNQLNHFDDPAHFDKRLMRSTGARLSVEPTPTTDSQPTSKSAILMTSLSAVTSRLMDSTETLRSQLQLLQEKRSAAASRSASPSKAAMPVVAVQDATGPSTVQPATQVSLQPPSKPDANPKDPSTPSPSLPGVVAQATPAPAKPVTGPSDQTQLVWSRPRPSKDEVLARAKAILPTHQDYYQRCSRTHVECTVPADQVADYNKRFEALHKVVVELEPSMALYACYFRDDGIRKLLAICVTVKHQKTMLAQTPPKYILEHNTIHRLSQELNNAINLFWKVSGSTPKRPIDQKTAEAYLPTYKATTAQAIVGLPEGSSQPDSSSSSSASR